MDKTQHLIKSGNDVHHCALNKSMTYIGHIYIISNLKHVLKSLIKPPLCCTYNIKGTFDVKVKVDQLVFRLVELLWVNA